MMRKGKRESAAVYLTAAVILACFLVPTIDCYRLKKTERTEGRKESEAAKTIGVHEGKIVFGRVFEKGSVIDGIKKSSSNASAEDETTYQADFAGWSKGQTQDAGLKEASWRRMAPSLQCGEDQLKFRAVGPGASQFAVEQGNASPVPLAQVPSTCGYSMQRNSLALVMTVPYDGCNMVQEGGSYVLPMRWQGIPVSLWCPKPAAPAVTTAAPHQKPEMPQVPQYPTFFPPFYPYYSPSLPVTTAAPTTIDKPAAAKKPKFPQYPSFYPPFYPMFLPPLPVATAGPTTANEPMFPLPFFPPYFPPFPYFPPPTDAPTTPIPSTEPLQFPPYAPFFPPYPFFPPPIPPYPTSATGKPELPLTPSLSGHQHFHPHSHFLPYPPPYAPNPV